MSVVKQLSGKDHDLIINYFDRTICDQYRGFIDPYVTKASEFSAFIIKDNLFNYRNLYYSNLDCTEMLCVKLRKKPQNSLIADVVFADFITDENFVKALESAFNDIKRGYNNINKINICLLEEDISKYQDRLNILDFSCEVLYQDEFGLGNNVIVYSRYL